MTTAAVFIGNVDDEPLNADWLLNANKVAAVAGNSGITSESLEEPGV